MRAAGLVLTAILTALPPAQQGPTRIPAAAAPQRLTLVDLKHVSGTVDMKRLRDWVALVEAHQPSIVDDSVKTIVSWPASTLALTLTDVSELSQLYAWWHARPLGASGQLPVYREHTYVRESPAGQGVGTLSPVLIDDVFPLTRQDQSAGHLNRLLLRGVLLQTDVALYVMHTPALLLRQQVAQSDTAMSSVGVSDGQVQGFVDSSQYWRDARFLLEAIDADPARYASIPKFDLVVPDPTSEPLVSFWYRAVCASLASEAQWANAGANLERGLELFPADDRLVFDGGVLHEVMAGAQAQQVAAALVRAGSTPGFMSGSVELGLAADLLHQVVEHDPTIAEAALHYGRVLGMSGKHREALEELTRARDGLKDLTLRYYAFLLLGREQSALGDAAAAHESFAEATALFPAAQSPHIADSLLARRDGDVPGAAGGLSAFLSLPPSSDPASDPWWQYERSHSRDGAALLSAMRAAFSHGS